MKDKERQGRGRPKAVINWDEVDKYLQAQCDGAKIASLLGIHPNTLYLACEEKYKINFSEYSAQKRGEGKELLRARQFKAAMDGDKTMLIWLGKQYLGQREKSDSAITISDISPVINFGEEKDEAEL